MSCSSEKCLCNSEYNSLLTLAGVSAIASAIFNNACSDGEKASYRPVVTAAISSSLTPYILLPAELASIQNGQPTRTAVFKRFNEHRDRDTSPTRRGRRADKWCRESRGG